MFVSQTCEGDVIVLTSFVVVGILDAALAWYSTREGDVICTHFFFSVGIVLDAALLPWYSTKNDGWNLHVYIAFNKVMSKLPVMHAAAYRYFQERL